jgi:hypothetical protein
MNDFGNLGLNDTDDRNTPTEINFFQNLEIINIYGGQNYTFVLLSNILNNFSRKWVNWIWK